MSSTQYLRDNREWLERAARAGYFARGAVFLIIGYFAFRAAFASGSSMGSQDAVDQIAGASIGMVLLWLLVMALAFFAIWRVIQSLFDVDRHGTDAKGLAVRAGLLGSAVAYGALAFYAGSLAVGSDGQSSGSGAGSNLIGKAYEAGYGVWLTYAIAVVVIGVGAAHIYKGAKAGFEKYMSIPLKYRDWLKPVCQFGLIARGLTFFVIAFLLFKGASAYSGGAPGLEDALNAIASWSYGWLLLSLTGLGLIAFGVYGVTEGIYRRINVERAV